MIERMVLCGNLNYMYEGSFLLSLMVIVSCYINEFFDGYFDIILINFL